MPSHLGDASLIWPPFFVLALMAIVAGVLSRLVAVSLRGDWFSMEPLGYVAGAVGYALFAALFLWMDASVAAKLPDATWPGRRAMWRQTLLGAFLALCGAGVLGVVAVGGLSSLAQAHAGADGAIVVGACAVVGAIVTGAVANVRARRRSRIDPRALR